MSFGKSKTFELVRASNALNVYCICGDIYTGYKPVLPYLRVAQAKLGNDSSDSGDDGEEKESVRPV